MSAKRFAVEVRAQLPERLAGLETLADNLLYSWDRRVRRVFRHIDNGLWDRCGHNPKILLRRVDQQRLDALASDPTFLEELEYALAAYRTYRVHTDALHRAVRHQVTPDSDLIAYFCAEFGLHESLPIYSGGLGILAGDHCKAASDLGLPFVAVGLMYHQGYFRQAIDASGQQQAVYQPHALSDLPVAPARDGEGREIYVQVPMAERTVRVKVWQVAIGNLRLFLLDTALPENTAADQSITYQLYGGDRRNRLAQEMVLGVGGVRALHALGLQPAVWHINEGHATFSIIERCCGSVRSGLPFAPTLEAVAGATVFTTHTPVPAGHDMFEDDLIRPYLTPFAQELQVPVETLLQLGSSPAHEHAFNMTALGLRGSRFHNGVSKIHGEVAAQMEAYHWPQVPPAENPIRHVTNGVHVSTFLAQEWTQLFDMRFVGWRDRLTDRAFWQHVVTTLPDENFWHVRQTIKSGTLAFVRHVLDQQYRRNEASEAHRERALARLDPNGPKPLVLGFARRFATYKRATLLLREPERLAALLNDPERPVVLLYAGKAHPADEPGQALIRRINELAATPPFFGKLFFIEDYDLALGRKLVSGVDVWINTPQFPKEACGTSGQKAGLNGVLNVSVLDGWWPEICDGDNGWGLTPHREDGDSELRDQQEARDLLDVLEHQVVPTYFAQNNHGYSPAWVARSKHAMATILPEFNSQRMLLDYLDGFYVPAMAHARALGADDARRARELTTWKQRVRECWPGVSLARLDEPTTRLARGEAFRVRVQANLNGLSPRDVRLECVIGTEQPDGGFDKSACYRLTPVGEPAEDGGTLFELDIPLEQTGLFSYELRVFPYHPDLAHPFELGRMVGLD